MVETDAQEFASGVGSVVAVLDGGGVFGFPEVVAIDVPGPAAFDNLLINRNKRIILILLK